MAELKTKKNTASVKDFLQSVPDPKQRQDAVQVMRLMQKVTGAKPSMWGSSIIGFGKYRCKYPSGRELDWFVTGFSPRKASLTLYITPGFAQYGPLLQRLGKCKTGKSCLYIKRLEDVSLTTLEELIRESVRHVRAGSESQAREDVGARP